MKWGQSPQEASGDERAGGGRMMTGEGSPTGSHETLLVPLSLERGLSSKGFRPSNPLLPPLKAGIDCLGLPPRHSRLLLMGHRVRVGIGR